MPTVSNLAVSVTARTNKFNRKMKGARSSVRDFGRQVVTVSKRLVQFGAIAGGAVVGGLLVATRQSFKLIDATSKLASTFGIATDQLIGLQHGAVITGSSLEGMNKGIKEFVRRLGEASTRSGEMRDAISMLGLDAQTLVAMGTADALKTVADRIAALPNEFEQAEAAYRLFGRRGTELVKMFRLGSKGIDDFVRRVRLMGLTFTNLESAGIQNANDALFELTQTMRGTANQIATRLQPFVGSLATALVDMAIAGDGVRSRVAKAFEVMETGAVMAAKGISILQAEWFALRGVILGTADLATRAFARMTEDANRMHGVFSTLFLAFGENLAPDLQKAFNALLHVTDTKLREADRFFKGHADAFGEAMEDAMNRMEKALDRFRTGSLGKKVLGFLDDIVAKWNEMAELTLQQPKIAPVPLASLESLRGAGRASRVRATEFQQVSLSRQALGGFVRGGLTPVSDPQIAITNALLEKIRFAISLPHIGLAG